MRSRDATVAQVRDQLERYDELERGPEKAEALGRLAALAWALEMIDDPDDVDELAGLPDRLRELVETYW